MPVLTAAACTVSEDCPEVIFPQRTTACSFTPAVGGINDLYFIPCTSVMSETNILDVAWWQGLVTDGTLGSIGVGLGSIGKKGQKTERVGSCTGETITQITWALKYIIKNIDNTSADITREQVNTLLTGYGRFLVIARMCNGDDRVLPIGVFTTSDVNWNVPDNSDENQTYEFELSWNELAIPKSFIVAGLSAVVPKAKLGVPPPVAAAS